LTITIIYIPFFSGIMPSFIGIRVVRGPDWKWGDQDGGEGHVGTVTKDLGGKKVTVVWDSGQEGQYRTGPEGCYDLRVNFFLNFN